MTIQFTSVDQALRKARALSKKGATGEAQALLRTVLERYPGNKRAIETLQSLGAPAKARRGAGLTQQQVDALVALFDRGHVQEALAQAQALAARYPDAAPLHNLVGSCLTALGQTGQAIASYRKALALAPRSADVRTNLAGALQLAQRHDEALALLQEAIAIKPDHARALNNLGSALIALDRSAEAVAPLDKALALEPRYAEALNNRGTALSHVGRRDEALRDLERAIALRPGYGDAYANLSVIKTFAAGDPTIGRIESALAAAGPGDRMRLHFVLAKALDDIGDTDRAFEHYAEGNGLRRAQLGDTLQGQRQAFATIREMFAGAAPEPISPESATRRPVFILGMPRSGTSLVEQILASHPKVHGGGEMNGILAAVAPAVKAKRIDAAMQAEIRRTYLQGLDGVGAGEPVVTDKMPANFRWIGFIAAALPEATIIHTRRDPVAVGWSLFRFFFPAAGMEYSFDLDDIAAYTRLHDAWMAFWAEKLPGRIHELDYEALVSNQEAETRRLLDLCGLEWDARCLAFHETQRSVTTASTMQVRQKLYAGSSDAWRKYEKHLGPLIEALGASPTAPE